MKKRPCPVWFRPALGVAVLGFVLGGMPSLRAAEPLATGQWWGTAELGAGQLDRSAGAFSNNSGRFYFGLAGGIAANPHVLLGLEASGWLVQSARTDDPTRGAGVSQVFAVARLYPDARSPFHVHVGAGSMTSWNNAAGADTGHGSGWEAGLGYDAAFGRHGAITPFLRYTSGTAGTLKVSAVTLGVGFTWR